MQRILTALDNPDLHNRLKNIKGFYVYENDIQYKEGIIDILKIDKNFNVVIIYENLSGEIDIQNLIKEIKNLNSKIKIVFILESKNKKLEKILYNENIKNIFYNNEINFKEFINKLRNINFSEEQNLKKEIKRLKQELEKNKKINFNKENIQNLDNTEKIIFIIEDRFEEVKKYNKIISFIKEKYLIEDKKINIMFVENKKGINFGILKNVFKNYKILGKIKIK